METYKISHKNYLNQIGHYKERPHRKYVFVLFTSHANPKQVNVPFTVGLMNDTDELHSNASIVNYYNVYNQPSVVHVIGLVHELNASSLLETLKELLLTNELPLMDNVNNVMPELKQKSSNLSHMKTIWDNLVKEWQRETHKHFSKPALSQRNSDFSKQDLKKAISMREYGVKECQQLSMKLANNYDFDTNTATLYFASSDNFNKSELIIKLIKKLNGDWYLTETFVLGKVLHFRMSESLKVAAIAVVKRQLK